MNMSLNIKSKELVVSQSYAYMAIKHEIEYTIIQHLMLTHKTEHCLQSMDITNKSFSMAFKVALYHIKPPSPIPSTLPTLESHKSQQKVLKGLPCSQKAVLW